MKREEEGNYGKRCPDCGSSDIMKGALCSTGGVVFAPEKQSGLFKKCAYVNALACKRCGTVFALKLADNPDKLTD